MPEMTDSTPNDSAPNLGTPDASTWDRRYAATERLHTRAPDVSLVEFIQGLTPGSAVDLGSGEGRNGLWLARQGWQVTAVDHSEVALGRLAADAQAEGLSVRSIQADIADFLTRGERFDLVVLANIHAAADQRPRLLAAIAGAVAPGGHVYLIGHHLDSFGIAGPPDPERLYTVERVAGAFPGLDVLLQERRERPREGESVPLVDFVVWAVRPA